MAVSVHDVAKYILEKHGPMSAMKLQKLLYYSQAWSLVWDDRPLFGEPIEAWSGGTIVREAYEVHKGRFKVDRWPSGDPVRLDKDAKETIDAVLRFYAKQDAQWLSDLTHAEAPWKKARVGRDSEERGSEEISLESMMEYYSALPAPGG